jgi:cytochrome d ubiquinol oxidase subunit I
MTDHLLLARLQFALTAGSHFLFVALTLGLVTLVALMQTRATLTGSDVHARMVRFWGQLYVINYAVGIVTGLVMEFQFALNWTGLARVTGDVFGAPLALETIGAFFVESTFLGLWIFGWNRFNRWAHLAMIWVVALTAYFSAYFIMVTNGWLKNPVGFEMVDGKARLTDFGAMLTNPTTTLAFAHIVFGGLLTAGFFIAAVSGRHLFRRHPDGDFFSRSLRLGMWTVVIAIFPMLVFGGVQFTHVPESAEQGLAGTAQIIMFLMWFLMALMALVFLVRLTVARRLRIGRGFHLLTRPMLVAPFVGMVSGWIFREVGRQPWAVRGVLTTEDAVAPLSSTAALTSFVVFVSLFTVLVCVNFRLLMKQAGLGPEAATLGAPAGEPARALAPTF